MKITQKHINMEREFRKVGEWFTNLPQERMNMNNGNYECGTPACVGGWLNVYYKTGSSDFADGAKALASKILGIEDPVEIWYRWEIINKMKYMIARFPEHIWGNDFVISMFSMKAAYGVTGRTITTADVGKHFIGVADRLKAEIDKHNKEEIERAKKVKDMFKEVVSPVTQKQIV